MKQRHDGKAAVIAGQIKGGANVGRRGAKVAVGQGYDFGPRSGARRVQQQGDIVGLGEDSVATVIAGKREAAGRVVRGNYDLVDGDAQFSGRRHRR